jgi:beta-galactosidase
MRTLLVILTTTVLLGCDNSIKKNSNMREIITLKKGWTFLKGNPTNAQLVDFDDSEWQTVEVPHDWAIYGPFDKEIDKQVVAIEQNGETVATEKTGRTGSLPYIGEAWYRNNFIIPDNYRNKEVLLVFEGAMSEPEIFVNNQKVGEWKYGYSYFYFNITDFLNPEGNNLLAVKLRNKGLSSRWYPGAGLYRKVQLIIKNKSSFEQWGTFITTPNISEKTAQVNIKSRVKGTDLSMKIELFDSENNLVGSKEEKSLFNGLFESNMAISNPQLWSPDTPNLYHAKLSLFENGQLVDELTERFGIRSISIEPHVGFKLNGQVTKLKGVCLHHDLGPLGTAINRAALKRQLTILKDMGCNAIRSAHNMPSIEQLELCDEMGFMVVAESFDEWAKPKVKNGYNRFFNEYAEKDVQNLVRATRNHPSIIMWSAGNEVPDQWGAEGVKRAKWLQDIFHREDPTRLVTVGMDQVEATMASGFGALLDVPGLNYRTHLYQEAYERFPQGFILGSETASTVSSRGVYKFPVERASMKTYEDLQSSSYDLEHCSWSNLPEDDFILQDDYPWVIGEFVWTGFDYLGEPTPYDEFWPSRSSYFGINDLAGLPKDRFYLYRSKWNAKNTTLHILPHWNWEGREGETTPVFVYTSYKSAELFLNGRSLGVKTKSSTGSLDRYRLMWMDVKYEPGTLKVVALDDNGNPLEEKEIITAGKASNIVLETDRETLHANGEDLAFITVSVTDKDGNPCPTAANLLNFEVSGAGKFKAVCNGDATSLAPFHIPEMPLFSGKLVVIVASGEDQGKIVVKVHGEGLESAELTIDSK